MGLRESRILYDWLERETGRAPFVIDSSDLLKSPEDAMRAFCDHVGYPFEPGMLEWPAGQISQSVNAQRISEQTDAASTSGRAGTTTLRTRRA